MERKSHGWTLVDGMTMDLGGPRTAAFFEKCETMIPWDQLAKSIANLYPNSKRSAGRPHWPIKMMLKCLMIQTWYGLSDPQLEEMLRDRLSFRRFVGLGLQENTPDETTFVVFRRRLREAGHDQTLFHKTFKHLEKHGLILSEGTLVDATIIEAPRGRKREDGSSTRDKEASYTKKRDRTYHGFKAHIATDRQGLIKDYRFTTAKVHDSQCMDELIEEEKIAVYADSAYMDRDRKKRLQKRGVYCGIIERRVRGQGELSYGQQLVNRFCAMVRAAVEHPFAWMHQMGRRRARYRGLRRNAFDFAMLAIAYNWKRSFSLVPYGS